MSEQGQVRSAMSGRGVISVVCLLVVLVFLAQAASPQVDPQAAWRETLERIGAKDYQVAALLLDDLRRRDDFPMTREAGFLLGVALYRQQRWQEAVGLLETAAAKLPLLADYALYFAASAYQALGLKPQALAAFSRLLQEHPDSLLVEQAERERAGLYADAGQLSHAEVGYREYLARASDPGRRREAMLALAEVNLKQGNRGAAEELLRQLWLTWPESQIGRASCRERV